MPSENKTRYAVLGLLNMAPMTGYQMRKVYESSLGHFWSESYSHLYAILKVLEAEGLRRPTVVARRRPSRPPCLHHRRAPAARPSRTGSRGPPPNSANGSRSCSRSSTGPSGRTGRDGGAHAGLRRPSIEALLARYADYAADLRAPRRGRPRLTYFLLTLRCGQQTSAAMVAWCDEALETLAKLAERQVRAGRARRCRRKEDALNALSWTAAQPQRRPPRPPSRSALIESLRASGWQPDDWPLRDTRIAPCDGDFGCWIKTPGRCVRRRRPRGVAAHDGGRPCRAVLASHVRRFLVRAQEGRRPRHSRAPPWLNARAARPATPTATNIRRPWSVSAWRRRARRAGSPVRRPGRPHGQQPEPAQRGAPCCGLDSGAGVRAGSGGA